MKEICERVPLSLSLPYRILYLFLCGLHLHLSRFKHGVYIGVICLRITLYIASFADATEPSTLISQH